MNYYELIAKALKGRSVNAAAKAWGVPQPTLDSYVKGKTMPDFDIADRIIKDAEIDPVEGFKTLVDQARINKASRFKLQSGFVQTEALVIGAGASFVAMLSILC